MGFLPFQKKKEILNQTIFRLQVAANVRTTSIYCQFCLNDAQDKLIKPSRNGLQSYQRSPIQELNDGYDFRRYSQDQNHHKRLQ